MVWGSGVSGKLGLGEITEEYECFCQCQLLVFFHTKSVPVKFHVVRHILHVLLWMDQCLSGGVEIVGALGLGKPLKSRYYPTRVKALRGIEIVSASCGSAHTVLLSAIKSRYEGEGVNRMRVYSGGDVYVCGAASVLKNMEPKFKRVDGLRDQVIREASAGYVHCLSIVEGEMFCLQIFK